MMYVLHFQTYKLSICSSYYDGAPEAQRLLRRLHLQRLHPRHPNGIRDTVSQALVDRSEDRYCKDKGKQISTQRKERYMHRLLDVRCLALISALFALPRWPATLLTRCVRSSSFKTFDHSARGCSKSTEDGAHVSASAMRTGMCVGLTLSDLAQVG